jgi:hypothetical protein
MSWLLHVHTNQQRKEVKDPMHEYETPELMTPEEMYEKPMLLDLEEVTACAKLCGTGGSGSAE